MDACVSVHAPSVLLRGGGVSAATCAHLLSGEGFTVHREPPAARPAVPVVMLSDAALALLRDVFGRADLFAQYPRIERRVVSWGNGPPATLPHGAIAVSGAEIDAELGPHASALHTSALHTSASPLSSPAFANHAGTVHAAPPFPDPALRRFGTREAIAVRVDLAAGADRAACHVEAVAGGWLFLIPQGPDRAWLLGVGDSPDTLLGQSRFVAAQVAMLHDDRASFETAPRMLKRLAGTDETGKGWIACGTAAIAFDPICGDGTAQAAREAILAAAVIAGLRDGGDAAALLGHYEAMLIASMRRHLQISLPFYRAGGDTPWWRAQADMLAEGYAWCTRKLAVTPEPRFILRGTRLVPKSEAA